MRKKDLRRNLESLLRDVTRQGDTIALLREELHRVRTENARLHTQLDELRADNQTQAAFLREGYRSKTGEIL